MMLHLQELGVATPDQVEHAKEELAATEERFSAILMRLGILRDVEAGRRLGPQLGAIPQRLDQPVARTPSSAHVPSTLWRLHRLVPVREAGGKLLVATDDPLSVFALEWFSRRCACMVEAVLVTEQELTPLLSGLEQLAATGPPAPAAAQPVTAAEPKRPAPPPTRFVGTPPTAAAAAAALEPAAGGDEPIIRLVDSMLSEAVRMRASDIHVEPSRQQLQVRYRIDGVLHDVNTPPTALHGPLVSRIKIMSGLNIAEKRLPQDGRLQLEVDGRLLDVRVSILPAMHGESIVMRLLDRSQPVRGLKEMGLLPEDQQQWELLIHRPHGMVLVTGPTGSGKTTTLYGALSMLNQVDRKLITVEDPVEYQLAGVNQVAVKSAIGLTFAAGLRSMLRQAPDVIMVGEIRDQETAQIAVQAALTGHLVLSTLHTNDAPSAVTRLIDMGIAPFLVASTLQGVLAQRLVRRLCSACRMTDNATVEERAFLGAPEVVQVIRSNGCDRCHDSGYLGRIGLFELLTLNDAIRQLVVNRASATEIRTLAKQQGMRTLRDDGCLKVREGLTTVAEVLRVVSGD
jgi:type II secretion system protein E